MYNVHSVQSARSRNGIGNISCLAVCPSVLWCTDVVQNIVTRQSDVAVCYDVTK